MEVWLWHDCYTLLTATVKFTISIYRTYARTTHDYYTFMCYIVLQLSIYVQYDIHHASMVDFCLQCMTSEKFNTTSETVVVYLPDSTFTGVVKKCALKGM